MILQAGQFIPFPQVIIIKYCYALILTKEKDMLNNEGPHTYTHYLKQKLRKRGRVGRGRGRVGRVNNGKNVGKPEVHKVKKTSSRILI